MARSVDVILKEQLGNLLFQLGIVQSQLEEAQDKIKAFEVASEANKPEKVIE